jgi:hypothetical protein
MSTASPRAAIVPPGEARWAARILVREMWASPAVTVMWLVVLFDALFGPDFVTSSVTSSTRIPSALLVALFAYLSTRVVARQGFDRCDDHG